jgi:hypothetical protein
MKISVLNKELKFSGMVPKKEVLKDAGGDA